MPGERVSNLSKAMNDESQGDLSNTSNSMSKIYHELQSKQLCALHALNNLFQDPRAFSKQDLDAICKELSPGSKIFNPHRSVFGLGCYDVNVIISALAKKGFDVIWFDKRKELNCLQLDNIYGFILNVPNPTSDGLFAFPLNYIPIQAQIWSSQKHWISIRKIDLYYYNLDSKLTLPSCIGNSEALIQFLRQKSTMEQAEILIVVTKSVSEDERWLTK